ncbi:MAG: hypothetical protein AABW99_04910 [archaeon]
MPQPVEELRFAQKYFFSTAAKMAVKQSGYLLEDIPESVLRRAGSMVASAFEEKNYGPRIEASPGLLLDEILAFPAAKILVSMIDRFELYRKFCSMVSDSVFLNLENEKSDVLLGIAMDLGLKANLSEDKFFFVELGISDYLRPELDSASMKLANAQVSKGKVFLDRNLFARHVSMIVAQELRESLPVPVKGVPAQFKSAADSLKGRFAEVSRKQFSRTDFGGVAPENFPPCMAKIYSELIAGVKVNHSARFAIATFLYSIGMEPEKIIDMYRQTPNFNERTTRYQVERLVGSGAKLGSSSEAKMSRSPAAGMAAGYSAPSCDKMRSYNLCVANCHVSHPVQFYTREKSKPHPESSGGEKIFSAPE